MKRPTTKSAREKETLRRMTEALGRDLKAGVVHKGKMREEAEKCGRSTAKA